MLRAAGTWNTRREPGIAGQPRRLLSTRGRALALPGAILSHIFQLGEKLFGLFYFILFFLLAEQAQFLNHHRSVIL